MDALNTSSLIIILHYTFSLVYLTAKPLKTILLKTDQSVPSFLFHELMHVDIGNQREGSEYLSITIT